MFAKRKIGEGGGKREGRVVVASTKGEGGERGWEVVCWMVERVG